jgi:hypothetical protein
MRKFIRNDYTLINRLKKIEHRYMELSCKHKLSDTRSGRYFRLYLLFSKAIKDTKEDMRMRALQRINSSEDFKLEYQSLFSDNT